MTQAEALLSTAERNLAYWKSRMDLFNVRGSGYHRNVDRYEEIVRELKAGRDPFIWPYSQTLTGGKGRGEENEL